MFVFYRRIHVTMSGNVTIGSYFTDILVFSDCICRNREHTPLYTFVSKWFSTVNFLFIFAFQFRPATVSRYYFEVLITAAESLKNLSRSNVTDLERHFFFLSLRRALHSKRFQWLRRRWIAIIVYRDDLLRTTRVAPRYKMRIIIAKIVTLIRTDYEFV